VHTFNALLAAIAASRYPTVESSLAVLEDMETCNVLPSDESFSVLLATMAETGEMKVSTACALRWHAALMWSCAGVRRYHGVHGAAEQAAVRRRSAQGRPAVSQGRADETTSSGKYY
jgi:hypothetical protein